LPNEYYLQQSTLTAQSRVYHKLVVAGPVKKFSRPETDEPSPNPGILYKILFNIIIRLDIIRFNIMNVTCPAHLTCLDFITLRSMSE
jgi:hypothetical protein